MGGRIFYGWWVVAAAFTVCFVAVWLLALIGVGTTVGRFFLGGLADKIGRINSLLIMFLGMGRAMLAWAYSGGFWARCLPAWPWAPW
jgi:predicted MFS family arabinose efflux permease